MKFRAVGKVWSLRSSGEKIGVIYLIMLFVVDQAKGGATVDHTSHGNSHCQGYSYLLSQAEKNLEDFQVAPSEDVMRQAL